MHFCIHSMFTFLCHTLTYPVHGPNIALFCVLSLIRYCYCIGDQFQLYIFGK